MQCPFCGNEMEHGTLRSRGYNYFLPEGQRAPIGYTTSSLEKRNAVELPPDPYVLTKPQWPEAYCCRGCRKLIVSY